MKHPRPTGREGRPRQWLFWHSRIGKWQVRVKLRGKLYHVGFFALAVDACIARNAWLSAHVGGLAVALKGRRRRGRPTSHPELVPQPTLQPVTEKQEDEEVSSLLEEITQALKNGETDGS